MKKTDRKTLLSRVKRVVIKIGSSVLTNEHGELSEGVFDEIAGEISRIKSRGIEPIIVSSGAIAAGMKKLNLGVKPRDISMKQAIAACGQSALMWYYEKAFSAFGEKVAQILLTHDVLSVRKRFLNARKTLFTLLRMEVIPIVNENDTVAVEEIMLGDNDNLAALVTSLVEADLLVLLTDIEGLYNKDPRNHRDAELITLIDEIDERIEEIAGETLGRTTTGGMRTKIEASKTAAAFGVPTIIANGKKPTKLSEIFSGKDIGTLFLPAKEKLKGRKHWIAFTLKPSGEIRIDDGAKRAISSSGKSLLPAGIKDVSGEFEVGELVRCIDEGGIEVARGLSSYSSDEIRKIAGAKTSEIEKILGYRYSDEVIHRDDLVVVSKKT
ncbi:MAG: glutamate 5-kinase, glutamate 5-kinase [Candidatus Dadabacteria bacterium CSP1-2]|nr:MAG: glutamate 5-kinase, glutamate 5-kinase [Candidatus Dadabacteria bacterium CSP1-2]OGE24762.1 MAG: glutamate 5-kinase [Candidatus Dadabacteria bacterium RBG_19FT_COMBO_40_33]